MSASTMPHTKLNGITATKHKHFHETKLHDAKHLIIWSEAVNRGTSMIFITYAKNHAGDLNHI